MRDRVTISHRGAKFEIGSGRDYYGIWAIGDEAAPPIERWSQTPEGWHLAWGRLVQIEDPTTILPAPGNTRRRTGTSRRSIARLRPATGSSSRFAGGGTDSEGSRGGDSTIAAVLLGLAVTCSVIGLFPSYVSGTSLASQPADLIPHVSYLAVWALAAVLLVTGTASRAKRARIGALLAAGSAVATFGFFFADAGTAIAEGGHVIGAGLVLSLAGWLLAAAGAVVAMAGVRPVHSGESGLQRVRIALPIVAAALGTAIAFAPSWDSYNLQTASGQSTTVVLGNAFSNPGAVIAGNVAVMVGLVLVAVAAAFWRPVVTGAALLAGAIVPMLAQFVSALVQVGEATPASQFGISPAQASEAQLHITSGLTATFTVFSVFLAALIVLWAGMFVKVKMQLERRNESWAHDPQPTSFHASAP